MTLSSDRAAQGHVVALYLTGILDGEPSLETDLGTVWFRRTAGGCMRYIPITYNAEGGDHTLQLTCGSLTRDLTLTVTNTQHKTVELPAEEDVGGAEDRNAIWPLYTNSTGQKLWNGLFVAPTAAPLPCTTATSRCGTASAAAIHRADLLRPRQRPSPHPRAAPSCWRIPDPDRRHGGHRPRLRRKSYLFGLKTVTAQRGQTIEAGSP